MGDCEKRLEKACALAEGLKRSDELWVVEVLLCSDGIPWLHAYKNPTTSDLEDLPRLVKFKET